MSNIRNAEAKLHKSKNNMAVQYALHYRNSNGVTQYSILVPLHFILYLNENTQLNDNIKIIPYADDTTAICSAKIWESMKYTKATQGIK